MASPSTERRLSFPRAELALPAAEVAKLLNISERHLWALHSSGRLPRPIRLGRSVRWNHDELRRWVDAGCPDRSSWDQAREGGNR